MFLWWSGATLGTLITIGKRGRQVGSDEFGNKYYDDRTDRKSYDKERTRRWVIYKGYADASKIPPDWHGWMHYIYDTPPSEQPLRRKTWEKPHEPNLSGTPFARFPSGSLNAEGQRQASSGDYEAWNP